MDTHDRLHIKIESLQGAQQCAGAGVWGLLLGTVEIGLYEDLLTREICDQHAGRMGEPREVVDFHHPGLIGENVLLDQGLEDVAL